MRRRQAAIALFLCAAGLAAVAASCASAPGLAGVFGALLAVVMLAIAIIDWRTLIIPDELVAAAFLLGLAAIGATQWRALPTPAIDAALRAIVMAALFVVFRFAYRRLRGREGMGLGDAKLAAVAGVWLAWPWLPIMVEIATLCALTLVLARHLFAGHATQATDKLPFGAFLAPAIWLCWLLAQLWS